MQLRLGGAGRAREANWPDVVSSQAMVHRGLAVRSPGNLDDFGQDAVVGRGVGRSNFGRGAWEHGHATLAPPRMGRRCTPLVFASRAPPFRRAAGGSLARPVVRAAGRVWSECCANSPILLVSTSSFPKWSTTWRCHARPPRLLTGIAGAFLSDAPAGRTPRFGRAAQSSAGGRRAPRWRC